MKIIIIILFLSIYVNSQESYPCYIVDNLQPGQSEDLVEAIISKKLNLKKNIEIIFIENKILWFYKKVLWRIDIKDHEVNCNFIDDLYIEDEIKVIKKDNNIIIMNYKIWENIVKNK